MFEEESHEKLTRKFLEKQEWERKYKEKMRLEKEEEEEEKMKCRNAT